MQNQEELFDKLLTELSRQFGEVDLSNAQQTESAKKIYQRLLKEDVMVKNKETGSVYFVKKLNPSTQTPLKKSTAVPKEKSKEPQVSDVKNKDANVSSEKIKAKGNELKKIPYASKEDAAIGAKFLAGLSSGDLSSLKKNASTISKYFRINPTSNEGKLYFVLKEPGNFAGGRETRDKIILPKPVINAMKQAGIKSTSGQTTSTGKKSDVGGDILSVSNYIKNKTPKRLEIKESDTQVTLGDHSIPILNEPLFDELVASFVKKGIEPKQARAEAGIASRAIKTHNELVKYTTNLLKDPKFNKFVDPVPGVTPSSPEGRTKIKNKVLEDLSSTILQKVKTKSAASFSNRIKALVNSKNFEKDILQISFDMEKDSTMQRANQRFVETISYLRKLHAGYIAYMPASSNFPLADVISIKELNLKENPTTDEIISALNLITVSIDFGSVKKDSGAAASVSSKLNATIYKSPKTRKNLETIKDTYDIIWKGKNPDEASKQLNAMAKKYNIDIKKYTTPDKLERVNVAWKRFKNQYKDPELYRKQLTQYIIAGQMIEEIYNGDIQSQMFSNEKYKMMSDHIEIQTTDGIKSVSEIRLKFNGFHSNGTPNAKFPTMFYKKKE
jgi:hypothetical protein